MSNDKQGLQSSRRGVLKVTAAADYLRNNWHVDYSWRALKQLTDAGEGPKFYFHNNDRLYPFSELDAFAEAKLGPLLAQADPAPKVASSTKKVDAAADKARRHSRDRWRNRGR